MKFDLGYNKPIPPPPPGERVSIAAPEPVIPHPEPVTEPVPDAAEPRRLFSLAEITKGTKNALPVLLSRFAALFVAFMLFYLLADYTQFTTAELHPGELIFSNTMIQLWTATYRLVYIYIIVLVLFSIISPTLWALYKPDGNQKFDLSTFVINHLTPTQQVCLFFIAFWFHCYLFIQLLLVKLPESVSVGP